jgi:superfamily II DNA or RNA helicase
VEERQHGRRLKQLLGKAGVATEFVFGLHSVSSREQLVRELVDGDLEVLICSVVFQDGIDVPSLRSVVVGTGKKSAVAALQRIGRGMRVDQETGKREFEVWDIWDVGHRWLSDHSLERLNIYRSAGHDPSVLEEELCHL